MEQKLASEPTTLLVNEIFGPTWQGEGSQAGRLCAFVRLATCNLACVWCDTPHAVFYDERKANLHRDKKTYDPKVEIHRMDPTDIVMKIQTLVPMGTLIVVSGGEPMLQSPALSVLFEALYNNGFGDYAIETAGTKSINPVLQRLRNSQGLHITVSPKLANSGNSKESRFLHYYLQQYADYGCHFKFVVTTSDDLFEVQTIVNQLGLPPAQVWIMPEGIKSADVIWNAKRIQNKVLASGWNLTLRQQIILNDDKRGV